MYRPIGYGGMAPWGAGMGPWGGCGGGGWAGGGWGGGGCGGGWGGHMGGHCGHAPKKMACVRGGGPTFMEAGWGPWGYEVEAGTGWVPGIYTGDVWMPGYW